MIDVPVYAAGPYAFYTTYTPLPAFTTGEADVPKPTQTKTYYIDVSPKLVVQKTTIPLDALSIISVLSKFMGEYPEDWDKHLHGISERGYNMVHFTPLQMRGDSNSPYSIYDQLTFDKDIFPNGEQDIANLTGRMESEYGLLSMTDVVLNHTANNSKWLEEHPDAGYNINTAPWLEAAYVLDSELLKFSAAMPSRNLPTTLNTVDELLEVMDRLKTDVIGPCKLWEYYVCNVEQDTNATVAAWMDNKIGVS